MTVQSEGNPPYRVVGIKYDGKYYRIIEFNPEDWKWLTNIIINQEAVNHHLE